MEDDCAVCGESERLHRDCKYCTGVYCPEHALPEKHNCPGVNAIAARDEWFLTPETGTPTQDGEQVEPREEPLEHDEIRTYRTTAGRSRGRPETGPDANREDVDSPAGGPGGADGGVVSRLVSALRFWS